jgi:hypothetical protein
MVARREWGGRGESFAKLAPLSVAVDRDLLVEV